MLIAAAVITGVLFWLSVADGHSMPVLGLLCFGLSVLVMLRRLQEMADRPDHRRNHRD